MRSEYFFVLDLAVGDEGRYVSHQLITRNTEVSSGSNGGGGVSSGFVEIGQNRRTASDSPRLDTHTPKMSSGLSRNVSPHRETPSRWALPLLGFVVNSIRNGYNSTIILLDDSGIMLIEHPPPCFAETHSTFLVCVSGFGVNSAYVVRFSVYFGSAIRRGGVHSTRWYSHSNHSTCRC